jgi:2-phosphosulfolactate phosphatase
MTVDVVLLPRDLIPLQLTDRAVAVFDVLRATTSITAALSVGVTEVRVFGTLDECLAAAAAFDGPKLTCGERHTLPPPGFDLGNSPGQFTPDHAGRTVFMTTTNGTKAIVAARAAPLVITAALVNATAAARVLAGAGRDVTLLCSGSDGAPSLEDTLGCGAVLHALQGLTDVSITGDLARIALQLFAACRDRLPATLADTFGGHNIRRVKLDADIAFAARLDVFDVVGRVGDGPLRVTR